MINADWRDFQGTPALEEDEEAAFILNSFTLKIKKSHIIPRLRPWNPVVYNLKLFGNCQMSRADKHIKGFWLRAFSNYANIGTSPSIVYWVLWTRAHKRNNTIIGSRRCQNEIIRRNRFAFK